MITSEPRSDEELASPPQYDWLALLLQTADPLFPTGAYAHSLGLEEIVRLGIVHNEPTLREFLQQQIAPALQQFELPFLHLAHQSAVAGDLPALLDLSAELDAWKLARELREASLQIGTRRLQTLLKVAPTPLLSAFAGAGNGSAHHLIVCALQGAAMPSEAVLITYYYQTLAGYCSAALKLIRIGQEGCQRVLRDLLAQVGTVVQSALALHRNDIGFGSFGPMLEIAGMRHERAFERLFIS